MSDFAKLELMAKIANLYYILDQNQTEIGKTLKNSRSTGSRLLQEARKTDLLEIIFRYPLATIPSLETAPEDMIGI